MRIIMTFMRVKYEYFASSLVNVLLLCYYKKWRNYYSYFLKKLQEQYMNDMYMEYIKMISTRKALLLKNVLQLSQARQS